jgi:hypothetical protein
MEVASARYPWRPWRLGISILRLDGHTNIAAANRHHARDPQRTLKLLQAA